MNCGSLVRFMPDYCVPRYHSKVFLGVRCLRLGHFPNRALCANGLRARSAMLGATDAAETLVAEKTPFVPVEEKRGAVADENYPIRRLSFTAALTPGSQRRVHQDRARKGLLRCLAFAGLVLLLVLGLSRAAME